VLVNFTRDELSCKCGCGLFKPAPGFLPALQGLRDAMTVHYLRQGQTFAVANRLGAIIVNSACRCDAHNKGIGGNARSLHVGDTPVHPTGGFCAVDIKTDHREPEYREALEEVAWARGWSIGYGLKFLHLDGRAFYPATGLQQARFNY
jgi:hypothetical protein